MMCAQAYQQVMKRVARTLPAHYSQGSVNYCSSIQDNQGTLSNSYSLCDEQFMYPSASTSCGAGAINLQSNYAQRHDNTILVQQIIFQIKPQIMDSFVAMQATGNNAAMDASWSSKLEHADMPCGVIPSQHHPRNYRQTSPVSSMSRSSSWLDWGSGNGGSKLSPPFPVAVDGGCQDQRQGGASTDAPFMRQLGKKTTGCMRMVSTPVSTTASRVV